MAARPRGSRFPVRSGAHCGVPDRDHGVHPWQGTGRLRAAGDRPLADPDPPDQHPGHQHLGEPGPLHCRGVLRRQR
ncbi:hypothetical protein G6F35_018444 [Rhizopus arrhizus]|nr:hypothetical protein G6F35_018444 [Rhizopus arrhizus]